MKNEYTTAISEYFGRKASLDMWIDQFGIFVLLTLVISVIVWSLWNER